MGFCFSFTYCNSVVKEGEENGLKAGSTYRVPNTSTQKMSSASFRLCCPSAPSSPHLPWHRYNMPFCIRENLQHPSVVGTY